MVKEKRIVRSASYREIVEPRIFICKAPHHNHIKVTGFVLFLKDFEKLLVAVCLLKNVIHLVVSQSAGVGELCNFLLGAVMVIPAWLIYKLKPTKVQALIAMICGSLVTAVVSIFINYYITYPFYQEAYHMPIDAIIGMYRDLNNGVGSLWDALIWFNMPFTFVKFMIDSLVVFFIYKPLAKAIRKKD